jgi:hypothetical protein
MFVAMGVTLVLLFRGGDQRSAGEVQIETETEEP